MFIDHTIVASVSESSGGGQAFASCPFGERNENTTIIALYEILDVFSGLMSNMRNRSRALLFYHNRFS